MLNLYFFFFPPAMEPGDLPPPTDPILGNTAGPPCCHNHIILFLTSLRRTVLTFVTSYLPIVRQFIIYVL